MSVLSLVVLVIALLSFALAVWAAGRTASRAHSGGELPAENELQQRFAAHEITVDELRTRSADVLQARERVPRLIP